MHVYNTYLQQINSLKLFIKLFKTNTLALQDSMYANAVELATLDNFNFTVEPGDESPLPSL